MEKNFEVLIPFCPRERSEHILSEQGLKFSLKCWKWKILLGTNLFFPLYSGAAEQPAET